MHAISSYRGNRPTNKQPQIHRQDRLQYTVPQIAHSVNISISAQIVSCSLTLTCTNGCTYVIILVWTIIIVAGDFNQLYTSTIEVDYGLFQIVTTPTHNQNLIDKVFINQPDLFDVCCFKSLIKTKHLVVLLTPQTNGAHNCNYKRHSRSQRYYVTLYDLRSHHLDKLRYAFGNTDCK